MYLVLSLVAFHNKCCLKDIVELNCYIFIGNTATAQLHFIILRLTTPICVLIGCSSSSIIAPAWLFGRLDIQFYFTVVQSPTP